MKRLSDNMAAPAVTATGWLLPLFAMALPLGALVQIKLPVGPSGLAITLSDFVVAVALPVLLIGLWRRRSLNVDCLVPRLPTWLALASLALIMGVGVGLSRHGFQGWTITRLIGWFVILAHVLTAAWIASDASARRIAVQTFVIAAAAIIVVDLVIVFRKSVFFPSGKCGWVEPAFGLTPNPNAYAFMLLMALTVTLVEINRGLFGKPAINAVLVTVLVLAIALTSSRSAWLAAITIALVAIVFGWTRRWPVFVGCAAALSLVALLLLILVCATTTAVTDDVRALGAMIGTSAAKLDAPMAERFYTHRRAIELFLQHPFLGAGIGAFLADELSRGSWALIIHSTPLWLIAEIGLLGAGCFAAFAIAVVLALIGHIRNDTSRRKIDAITALLIVIAFGVMSTAQELLYQRSFWIMFTLFIFSPASGIAAISRPRGGVTADIAAESAAMRP